MGENQKNLELQLTKFNLFKSHLTALVNKFLPSVFVEAGHLKGITEARWEELWSHIAVQYKVVTAKLSEHVPGLRDTEIDAIDANAKPPSGKTIFNFLRDDDSASAASSSILEKTAIAYCYFIKNEHYNIKWLCDHLKKRMSSHTALNNIIENQGRLFYLLYFCNGSFNISYGIMEVEEQKSVSANIDTKMKEKRKVKLRSYSNDFVQKDFELSGVETDVGSNIFYELQLQIKSEVFKTLIVLYNAHRSASEFRYLFGTYAGANRSGAPLCGEIIFEKHFSLKEAEMAMRNTSSRTAHFIQNMLYSKRIKVLQEPVNNESQFPGFVGMNAIAEEYSGFYELKYISVPMKRVFKAFALIKASGKIELKIPGNITLSGKLKVIEKGNLLHAIIDYHDVDDYYTLQVALKPKNLYPQESIKGVYAGFGFAIKEPTAGRILLKLIEPKESKNAVKSFTKSVPQSCDLNSESPHGIKSNEYERQFFLGESDSFIESESFFNRFGILKTGTDRIAELDKRLKELETKVETLTSSNAV